MNINFPFNFIVIPAVTIATAVVGARSSREGTNSEWYANLPKPKWTPPGKTIGEVWTFLYILTTFSVMWYWNVPRFSYVHYAVAVVLLANAYLNARWSKLFFIQHDIPKAYQDIKLMIVTAFIAMLLMALQAPLASLGMLPYIAWLGFAKKLTKEILHPELQKQKTASN